MFLGALESKKIGHFYHASPTLKVLGNMTEEELGRMYNPEVGRSAERQCLLEIT